MTHANQFPTKKSQPVPFFQTALIGWTIGLAIISLFIFGVDGRPEWGDLWRIRPLIITPLAGAAGGAFYYFMNQLRHHNNVNPTVAIILSLLVFVVGLWMGIVLGLAGTMWN
jgi:uncharacterized membrane protein YsdA (DUF1294 family)